ncbi:MAG: methyl-accepting chemotaxis protein [Acidobacteria bacterium]|nr:MAG: methyl-accepting chemotaxis protein [Acidobacteriota bacterium]
MSSTGVQGPIDQAAARTGEPPVTSGRPHVFRRRYLIDWRAQLAGSVLSILVVVVLLVIVNVVLYQLGTVTTAAIADLAPDLAASLHQRDLLRVKVTLGCSIGLLAAFVFLRIVETHNIHGAAYNLARRLRELADGRLDVSARLRRSDQLHPLAEAFNEAVERLRQDAANEIALLEECAARAAGDPELSATLRGLARKKREALG